MIAAPLARGDRWHSLANNLADVYFSANEDANDLERFWQGGATLAAGTGITRQIDPRTRAA